MSFIDYDFLIIFCNVRYGTIFFDLSISGNCRQQNAIQFFSDYPILSEIKRLL